MPQLFPDIPVIKFASINAPVVALYRATRDPAYWVTKRSFPENTMPPGSPLVTQKSGLIKAPVVAS